jgi:DNA-binding transcriptional MocR family regulator
LEELTLNRFIGKGFLDQHLDRLKTVLDARAEALQLAIAEHLSQAVSCDACHGSMHLLVRFPSYIDSFTVEACAREARLDLVSSSAYYVSEALANEYLLPFVL